ncbi:WG repeat-containing protein [Flavobacterium sp.]|jgi:hypothetical protein|uniref:WG repeat-containing protein n=1 Tax=Flavobacterium sp. TaxID=239 RepID=UPI0037BF27D7
MMNGGLIKLPEKIITDYDILHSWSVSDDLIIFETNSNKAGLLRRKVKYGILVSYECMIEPFYERLKHIKDKFFKANQNKLFGIVDWNGSIILPFEYLEIVDTTLDNKIIVQHQNTTYFSFDLVTKSLAELPFDKILRASSNTYGAPFLKSYNYFKSIKNCTITNDDFSGHEITSYSGKWGIIQSDGKELIPNEYDFIDFLRNPNYYKVCKGELRFVKYEDDDGYDKISIENAKWGIIDSNNVVIVPIEYEWIDEVESTIWVAYKGGKVFYNDEYQEDYWMIKNGKLGVFNLNKLIVPFEYDSIKLSWFRIKEYIFVQKGKNYFEDSEEYDVFTLDGKKIESNKPKPRDFLNNG